MDEKELNNFFNSNLMFDYLLKNKTPLTAYLADNTKISGRLLGWDNDYLLILFEKTLQMVPVVKLIRLQADLNNLPVTETPAVTELPKPKFTPEPVEGNDIKNQLMAEKAQNAINQDDSAAKDRLDNLVKNW